VALDRGLPRRIRLHFDENPESGSVTIVTFAREGLVPVALPPVGQSLELPRVTTLLSM
jgi:hypothetical protein